MDYFDVLFPSPHWPSAVFHVMSILTIPLYIVVFFCLLRLRCVSKTYNSTFYTLLLQQCIADIFSMTFFYFIQAGRAVKFLRELYYQEEYIPAVAYDHIFVTLYIRCTGIIFLSFQRYLAIVRSSSLITKKIESAPKSWIVGIYWFLPTLLSLTLLKNGKFHYDRLETMGVVVEKADLQRNSTIALVIVGMTCILCSMAYSGLYRFIKTHSSHLTKSVRHEISLAVQVFILLISFFAILVYYVILNYFARTHNTGPIFYMRGIFPMASGFLSYSNPYCILLLNKDFARHFIASLLCRKLEVSDAPLSATPMTTIVPITQKRELNKIDF